jgi:hypothetical protein
MSSHRFKVGRSVFLERTTLNRDAALGPYEVIRQLPERNGEFEYQIKSTGEPHARVVRYKRIEQELIGRAAGGPSLILRRANASRISGRWQDEDYDVFDGEGA